MKKIKYIIGAFLGLSSVGIIAPIAASCSTNSNQNSEPDYYNEINEAEKHLITKQSAIDLNNMFIQNVSSRLNNQEINKLTREEIASKVVIDENNFIYQKLKEDNLDETFKEDTINVIYCSYLDELNEMNQNNNLAKCGSFFSGHFWEAVGTGIRCTVVYAYSALFMILDCLNPIQEYLKDSNVEKFRLAIGNLKIPKHIAQLIIKTVIETKTFKTRTRCRWSFWIWKGRAGKPSLVI